MAEIIYAQNATTMNGR